MKKYLLCLAIIVALAIVILPAKGYAGWVLYDDFNYTGDPNPDLWAQTGISADVTIENGECKFVHHTNMPNMSKWLRIKKFKHVKAVRVNVRFEGPCYGGVRGRIGGDIGQDYEGIYYVFQNISVNDSKTISTWTGYEDPNNNYQVVDPIFSSTFGYWPIEPFYNEYFTIQMTLNRNQLNFRAFGYGKTKFMPPDRIFRYEDSWAGIGTRNSYDPVGTGECSPPCECSIYFDDVYVEY